MKPHMSKSEIQMFEKYIQAASNYLEYGCGGSTYMASCQKNVKKIVSVEGALTWITKLKAMPEIRATFHHIDYNADEGNWSYPKDNKKVHIFPQYSDIIKLYPVNTFDTILVDGRFRVACICKLYDYSTEDTIILVHDYTNRPQYHIVEQFFDVVERVETLVRLRKKDPGQINDENLKKVIMSYQYLHKD